MKFPIDLEVRRLSRDEWTLIEDIWRDEYHSSLPYEDHSDWFYGAFLSGELVGFAHFEKLVHFNVVYVKPEHRNRHVLEGIFNIVDSDREPGESVVILPRSEVARTLKSYGFRRLEGDSVYRKDY